MVILHHTKDNWLEGKFKSVQKQYETNGVLRCFWGLNGYYFFDFSFSSLPSFHSLVHSRYNTTPSFQAFFSVIFFQQCIYHVFKPSIREMPFRVPSREEDNLYSIDSRVLMQKAFGQLERQSSASSSRIR